jgi:adenylate cyclase
MSLRLEKSILRKHQEERSSTKKFNILLVDDEQENLDSLSLVLDKEYNLLFANDGEHALRVIDELDNPEDIHMIVSDQRMPKLTGVDLFKKTTVLIPNAVRVILTGYTDVEAAISSINEGQIYKFLTKPIDPVDLRKTVRRGLEQHIRADEEVQKVVDLKKRVTEVENILTVFEKFVPRQLTSRISKGGVQNIRIGQAERDLVTILFADVRGFSSIAENLDPQELLNFLNRCFKFMSGPIYSHSGFVDKYIGDSIMAMFDITPGSETGDHAISAALAAIEMQKSISGFNTANESLNGPIRITTGIHTGPVVIGTVGAESRMDLTVMGDSVNITADLERYNDTYGSSIIASSDSVKLFNGHPGIEWRELDTVGTKGRRDPHLIYEIMTETIDGFLESYSIGLAHYHSGNWGASQAAFQKCLALKPEDKPSLMYIDRCESGQGAPTHTQTKTQNRQFTS